MCVFPTIIYVPKDGDSVLLNTVTPVPGNTEGAQ